MNLKLRLQNPATAIPLLVCVIGFVYQVLAILGITPSIVEADIYNYISTVALFILGTGIVVDPTTQNWLDSLSALGYDKPKDRAEEEDKMMMMPGDAVLKEDETASQEPVADIEEDDLNG